MPNTDLRSVLETQIQEAEADIERLRAALAVLDGPQAAPAPRRRQAAPKPETQVIPWGKLAKIVSQHEEGISATQLAKQTGGDQSAILSLLKKHEGEQVRREGERRATKWFVAADV